MTAYNRENFISDAIQSVLSSTLIDFELIIVDDCSTDNTLQLAYSYASADSRIKVFFNDVNLGDYPNRNKAASFASGKYLKYVDSDDFIYPWALDNLVKMMEDHPAAGWGLCSMPASNDQIFPFSLSPADAYRYHYFGFGLFHRAPLSSIIRKDIFESVGGFKPLRMVGDFDMWHRLALHHDVLLMPEGMVWYRRHNSQEILDFSHYLLDYEKIKLSYLKSPSCPLDAEEVIAVCKSEKYKIIKHMVSCLAKFKLNKFLISFRMFLLYYGKI